MRPPTGPDPITATALRDLPPIDAAPDRVPILHTILEHPDPYPPTVQATPLESTLFRAAPLLCLQAIAAGIQRAARFGMCAAIRGYALQLPAARDHDGDGVGGAVEVILYADRHHPATATAVLHRDPTGALTRLDRPGNPHHAELLHALQVIAASARTPGRTR